jgi:hypothetical protein
MAVDAARLEELAQKFEVFAVVHFAPSPLYVELARQVVQDHDLLVIAAEARSRPEPNLFMGAVHYLLLRGTEHELAQFYPSLGGTRPVASLDGGVLRDFCLSHREELTDLLRHRRVQTNEVGRCALLLLGLQQVSREAPGKDLALVEIGASAGLNLLVDRFAYRFGDKTLQPPEGSALEITCQTDGPAAPPVPAAMPNITDRVGIDLNPVDLSDPDQMLWLQGMIWPEHTDRLKMLRAAGEVALQEPPEVMEGDALEMLSLAVHAMPRGAAICVFHSMTLIQMPDDGKVRLASVLQQLTRDRLIFWISLEVNGVVMAAPRLPERHHVDPSSFAVLGLIHQTPRGWKERALALCDPHGRWVEWLP